MLAHIARICSRPASGSGKNTAWWAECPVWQTPAYSECMRCKLLVDLARYMRLRGADISCFMIGYAQVLAQRESTSSNLDMAKQVQQLGLKLPRTSRDQRSSRRSTSRSVNMSQPSQASLCSTSRTSMMSVSSRSLQSRVVNLEL